MLYIIHADTCEIIRVFKKKELVMRHIERDLYKGLGWFVTECDGEKPNRTETAKVFFIEER